jgi:hypothetical protein
MTGERGDQAASPVFFALLTESHLQDVMRV